MKAGNKQQTAILVMTLLATIFTSCSLLDRSQPPANSTAPAVSQSQSQTDQTQTETADGLPNVEIAPVAKMNGPWRIITSNNVQFSINAPGANKAKLLYRPIGVEGRHLEMRSFDAPTESATSNHGNFTAEITTPPDFAGELWAEVGYPDGSTKITKSVPIMTEVAYRDDSNNTMPSVENEQSSVNQSDNIDRNQDSENKPDNSRDRTATTPKADDDKELEQNDDLANIPAPDRDQTESNKNDRDVQPLNDRDNTIDRTDHRASNNAAANENTLQRASFDEEDPNINIIVNVPAFRLELWQSDSLVKTYPISVGKREHPLKIDERKASEIIWNPDWIPPNSKWVYETKMKVRPGERIPADDPRNPLGKIKIPLGGGDLIHQVISPHDIGRMKSHGCIRMLEADLFDLSEKIVAARDLPVSNGQIRQVKNSEDRLVTKLDSPLSINVRYKTIEVSDGMLHIYPDIYQRNTNTYEKLQEQLQAHNIDIEIDQATFTQILDKLGETNKFAIDIDKLNSKDLLKAGKFESLTMDKAQTNKNPKKKNSSKPSRKKVIDRSA